MMRLTSLAVASLAGSFFLTGCNEQSVKSEVAQAQVVAAEKTQVVETQAPATIELFEVHDHGRIYSFYDMKTYQSFLEVGETPYQFTRIGAGPKGQTMVFGLTKDDKKKGENTPAVQLMDNKLDASGEFYGEMKRHGRIYVFDRKADMDAVRSLGEPSYMFTQIGAGKNGETLVFVLNKDNKKKQPVALMAKYKQMHAM